MNKVIIIGNIGSIKYTDGENPRANIRIATNEKRNGEKESSWHDVVAFGKLADLIYQYTSVGNRIMVCGKLSYNDVEKNGVKLRYTSIIANEIELLGGGRSEKSPGMSEEEKKQKVQAFYDALSQGNTYPF